MTTMIVTRTIVTRTRTVTTKIVTRITKGTMATRIATTKAATN